MLPANARRIDSELADTDLVLDVGGWAKPLQRADWVLDLMPYESRGLYGDPVDPSRERFTVETWVQMDMCVHEAWPFRDDEFDFAVCSHTLEDVRDPIWVCHELNRVARAGYVEVPSRLEEQTREISGPFVGWSHHHWLVDLDEVEEAVRFVFKPHAIHGSDSFSFPPGFVNGLDHAQRVQALFWTGSFDYEEIVMLTSEELDRYLAEFVEANEQLAADPPPSRRRSWRPRRF